MENNSAMVSFGDLMSILLACFMLVSALLATKVAQEYSTKVQLLEKRSAVTETRDTPGEERLFLSVTNKGNYVLEGTSLKGKKTFTTATATLDLLRKIHPANLYIRGDKGVSYGKVLDVLLDCQALGIRVALSADSGKGGAK